MPVTERYDPTPAQRAAVEALCAELSDPERCVTRRITAIHQAGNLVRIVHMQGTSVEDALIDADGQRVQWEPSVIAPYGVTQTGRPLGMGAVLRDRLAGEPNTPDAVRRRYAARARTRRSST